MVHWWVLVHCGPHKALPKGFLFVFQSTSSHQRLVDPLKDLLLITCRPSSIWIPLKLFVLMLRKACSQGLSLILGPTSLSYHLQGYFPQIRGGPMGIGPLPICNPPSPGFTWWLPWTVGFRGCIFPRVVVSPITFYFLYLKFKSQENATITQMYTILHTMGWVDYT